MKILNLHGSKRGLINRNNNTPIGGLEKTVVDLHNLLNANGVECWTNSCEADRLEGNYLVINPDRDDDAWRSRDKFSAFVACLVNHIQADKFTHVIVHGANRLASALTNYGVPFMFIDHVMDKSVNKLYHEKHFRYVVPKAKLNGSRFYSVSEYAKTNIEKRVAEQKLAESFTFDGYIKLQYITDELRNISVVAGDGSTITIGRCDTNKNPAAAVGVSKKLHAPLKIYAMMSNTNPKEVKYYETKLKQHSGVLKLNHSRSEMMLDLASSSLYISTVPHESAGVTAFEALSSGVPVLLLSSSNNHASLMYAQANAYFIRCMPRNSLDTAWIQKMLALSLEEKQEIRNHVWQYNSGEHVVSSLIEELNLMAPIKLTIGVEPFYIDE